MYDFKRLLTDGKTPIILIAVSAVLFFLLLFPSDKTYTEKNEPDSELSFYTRELEENLARVISGVEGAGRTQVFVTLESGFESVYASDASVYETSASGTVDTRSEKQLVLTGSGTSGQSPVVVKKISPKIKGVVIVCEGGRDEYVRKRITELAATAFNIQNSKIYVTGGNFT